MPLFRTRIHVGRAEVLLLMAISLLVPIWLLNATDGNLARASSAERAGDWAAAVRLYEEELQRDPDSMEALRGLAIGLNILREHDRALVFQEQLTRRDPNDAQIRLELGFNYLNHQERPEDAQRVMAEAAALQPSARNLTFLAQAQQRLGQIQAATDTLRRAVSIDPTYIRAQDMLEQLLGTAAGDGIRPGASDRA